MIEIKRKEHACNLCDENWHAFEISGVIDELKTDREGLSQDEVKKRQEFYGPNTLPSKEPPSLTSIILHQLMNPLIFILIAAAAASIAIGEATDAFFIFVVIAINSALGAYQEYNAEKSASSLMKLIKITARARRGGREIELPAEELVPGDIVLLESGLKVPADLRLMAVNNLAADESFLTGESIASEKITEVLPEEISIGDRRNMAFAGSTITTGRGEGVVVGTGIETQVGLIAQSVVHSESAKTPLIQRMERFTKKITVAVVVIAFILSIMLRLQGNDVSSIFFFVVALAVSAIPEGLPVALTVALSIAAKRMSKRNVIVRKLNAVEALGSCTVIASDKTGTLTVNQQTAREVILPDGSLFKITGEGYNGIGEVNGEGDRAPLNKLAEISILANEAALENDGREWTHRGDAMDVAFLAMAYKMGLDPAAVRNSYTLLKDIPYESENKYSAAVFRSQSGVVVCVKGAMETIIEFCDTMWSGGSAVPVNRALIEEQAESLAAKGLRVLALAFREADKIEDCSEEGLTQNMTFAGMVGFIDPLRPEAVDSVRKCREAGIRVIMITGDHPSTAGAIALELGLTDEKDGVVTGGQLSASGTPDSPAFESLVSSARVFARVSPTQKLEIVQALLRRGEFVAVTGDGVNDTPALKAANIGVAMGSGTDAAKEIGSMIITDDRFSSIVAGVEEGRFAYDNVRKVIYLLISTGAAEVMFFVAAIMTGMPLPLLAVQLLWLNLVTNGIQDVALAFEGGEPGAMKRRPRSTKENIFNPLMIWQTLVSGVIIAVMVFVVWYWLIEIKGFEESAARNIVLLLMVLMQNVHVFNCRSEYESAFLVPIKRNYLLIFGVLTAQGIHILSMHIPFMQELLRIEAVTFTDWATVLGLAFSVLVVMEAFKFIRKRTAS